MRLAGGSREGVLAIGDEPAERRARAPRFADLLAVAVVGALYVIRGQARLKLAFIHASATAVWPPAGIALAALLLRGYRLWPAVFLGAFVANITTAGSVATSLGIGAGNPPCEASRERTWSRRFASGGRPSHEARM